MGVVDDAMRGGPQRLNSLLKNSGSYQRIAQQAAEKLGFRIRLSL